MLRKIGTYASGTFVEWTDETPYDFEKSRKMAKQENCRWKDIMAESPSSMTRWECKFENETAFQAYEDIEKVFAIAEKYTDDFYIRDHTVKIDTMGGLNEFAHFIVNSRLDDSCHMKHCDTIKFDDGKIILIKDEETVFETQIEKCGFYDFMIFH